jgi:fructuronate reductase
LRILNMSHSTIAGLGVLLGFRGPYAISRAMQDTEIAALVTKIISIVRQTIERPKKMDPAQFAGDTLTRLKNPNIPDDPMRIALNGSTKMRPRFLDTYFAGLDKGIPRPQLDIVLVPVAGFLRYLAGIDDAGVSFILENDPLKQLLEKCGRNARLGETQSVCAFEALIAHPDIMGTNLYAQGDTGKRLESMASKMLAGPGAVRRTIREYLRETP